MQTLLFSILLLAFSFNISPTSAGTSITPLQSLTAYISAPSCVQSCVAAASYTYLYKFSCYNYGNPATCLCASTSEAVAPSSTVVSFATSCVQGSCIATGDVKSAEEVWGAYCGANGVGNEVVTSAGPTSAPASGSIASNTVAASPTSSVASTTPVGTSVTSKTSSTPSQSSATRTFFVRNIVLYLAPASTDTSVPIGGGGGGGGGDGLTRPAEIATIVASVLTGVSMICAVIAWCFDIFGFKSWIRRKLNLVEK